MGAWGPAIFSDDLACDLRDEFRDLIGEGLSSEEATERLWAEYDLEGDPDERPVFYLALAATQWKLGRLLDEIRNEALRVRRGDRRWKSLLIDDEDVGSIKRRQAAIEKLRDQLLQPQPAPKKVRKRFKFDTDWQIGHAVAYRLRWGRYVVLRVIGIHEDKGGRCAIVDLADGVWGSAPNRARVAGLGRMRSRTFSGNPAGEAPAWDGKFAVYEERPGEMPLDRLEVMATDLQLDCDSVDGAVFFGGWSKLDEYVEETFALR